MPTQPNLEALLLDLIAPQPPVPPIRLAALGPADWARLQGMIRQHRLGPLLYWQLTRTRPELPIPAGVRNDLAAGFKRSTLSAQIIAREILVLHRILTQSAIPYQALKGAFLAFHAYPQPGLRPLQDLDILVPQQDALRAFALLLDAGLTRPAPYQGDPRAWLPVSNHLPPLRSPSGHLLVELHARLRNPREQDADLSGDPAYWRRGITAHIEDEAVSFPSATDLLLHLIIHGVYHHRLNNGPLLLSDIAMLLRTNTPDWDLFWRLADQQGCARGCWLALTLTQRYWGNFSIPWPGGIDAAAGDAEHWLQEAAWLMLRDIEHEQDVYVITEMQRRSLLDQIRLLYAKAFPPRSRLAKDFPVAADSPRAYLYYFRHWRRLARQRLPRYLKARSQAPIRDEIGRLAGVTRWLENSPRDRSGSGTRDERPGD